MDVSTKQEKLITCYNAKLGDEISSFGGIWTGDTELEERLRCLQLSGESVKQAVTKVTMMRSAPVTASNMTVYIELDSALNSMVTDFQAICERCSVSKVLLEVAYKVIFAVFSRVKELTDMVQVSASTEGGSDAPAGGRTAPMITGMVWTACDELRKLPTSNKSVYRWVVLQSILTTKETIQEFSKHVVDAKKSRGEGVDGGGGDDDDGDDVEDDDEPYTPEETAIVEDVVLQIGAVQRTLRSTLQFMSQAAEVDGWGNSDEGQKALANLVAAMQSMRGHVVDLASELYSPFDMTAILAKRAVVEEGLASIAEMARGVPSS